MSELIVKAADYVKKKLYNEPSGHDWFHVERVLKMARKIQQVEGGDSEVVELAALLHNLGDHDSNQFNAEKGSLILFGMMDIIGIEEPLKSKILKIVEEMKYGGRETRRPSTLEGQIVQDANFLDTLGAIGVARHFASGGFYGRPIYDPSVKVREGLTKEQYEHQKAKGTSINNFYEKAFQIIPLLNTETAHRMAEMKAKYIKQFVDRFMEEWSEFEGMK